VRDAEALRTYILAADSVTLAMSDWCREHGIGRLPLRSVVHRRAGIRPLPADFPIRIGHDEAVWFREITLMAGDVPLLDADNWFLPYRISPDAAATLLETDTPFGTALLPGRQTRVSTAILVPEAAGALPPEGVRSPGVAVLTLRGIVSLDGQPVSYVEERFRPDLLG
jgi:chorismate-pyruvate lyase